MMRKITFLLMLFVLVACGSKQMQLDLDLSFQEYYFDRQMGGTQAAGINESYYFRVSNPKIVLDQLKVRDEVLELELKEDGLFWATTKMLSKDGYIFSDYNKVELFGHLNGGDTEMHWELDSVPLREQIFMPAAPPRD